MRAPKKSDSPSGATRDVYPLRRPHPDATVEVGRYLMQINREAQRLVAQRPELAGESAEMLFSRYIVPETAPGYDSVLRRAAFAVLHLRAVDLAETADPTSGGEAA